ncbi:glycosyltransferase [Pseudomonas sp. LJDD11]|nr:glycosyltransferase [Pseudomonas sp. LJDD11]
MNSTPLVSIVIPAFDPLYFGAALQSALDQSYSPLEIVISDDCPTQEICKIVESLTVPEGVRLRYLRNQQRLGFPRNLVHAVAQAEGEFIKVLCDDDRMFADCIRLQAQVLCEHLDVNLVLCQRVLIDANDYALPSRLINSQIHNFDTIFKGGDMLALLHSSPTNILGNFSSALMRTADVQAILEALTQEGVEFCALLDFALFICLLRRGEMAMLRSVLSAERIHSGRLSKQSSMIEAAGRELQWLLQMMEGRGGDDAPAPGWVRAVDLARVVAGQPHKWEELALLRAMSNLITSLGLRVGSESESYDEFYADWLAARRFTDAELAQLPRAISQWPQKPRIAVVVIDLEGDSVGLGLTLGSLESQMYDVANVSLIAPKCPPMDLSVQHHMAREDWVTQLNEIITSMHQVEWVYLLRPGDQLVESALLVLAERIAHRPGMLCIYSDESAWSEDVSREPVFKPDFNTDLMRSYPYVGRALAFSRQAILDYDGFDPFHAELAPQDLLWKLVEVHGPQTIGHIAEIQLASTYTFAQWLSAPWMEQQSRQLLRSHLERIGVEHRIRAGELSLISRVDYLSEHQPLVSIVISVGRRLAVLQRCIETLIEQTAYSRYEILLIDDNADDQEMGDWLAAMGQLDTNLLRVVRTDVVGKAALNNLAADESRGEYLLFLGTDTVFTQSQWLSELLNHAQRPEVGVTGGRILNPQGAIIHAGLIVGLGGAAASPFLGESSKARGYMQRLQATQNWSAISADCLMVRKEVFDSVNGFDADAFASCLHDVDLCLRIGKQGYLVVGTPYSSIVQHRLPAERSLAQIQERELERDHLHCRWIDVIARDPAYNPSLSQGLSSFALNPGLNTGWSPFCSQSLPTVLIMPVNQMATGHYRVIQPLTELQAAGRVVGRTVFDFPSFAEIERIAPDVIVLQCRYGGNAPAYIASLKKYSRALRIFELDDYVIKAPVKNAHARNKPADTEQWLRESIQACDRVVVTTQGLKDALSAMHDDIRVVPNMLAPHLWQGLKSHRKTSARPRVGWGGGTSHTGDLEVIVDVVRQLADEVDWVFFGMCTEELKPYVREFYPPVDLQRYPAKLASLNLDLALAPLEFHIFNDCKSNLRLLEYGACGYPVVCTDTEAYKGFLPCTRVKSNSTEEWIEAIRMHLADPEASYRMGDQLREAVFQNFMLSGDNLRHWEWGWLPD